MVCDQVFVLMKIKRGIDLTDMNGGLREISLSLRDAYMDIGGRTKSGTRVERARVRGIIEKKQDHLSVIPPSSDAHGCANAAMGRMPWSGLSFSRRENTFF
jgi:hypothetical protein